MKQEDNTTATEITNVPEQPSLWARLFGRAEGAPLPTATKFAIAAAFAVILIVVSLGLHASFPGGDEAGIAINYPESWDFGWDAIKFIDNIVDWVVINWDPFFSAINTAILRGLLVPLEDFFLWIPWWSIFLITGLLAWYMVSVKFTAITLVFLALIAVMGLLDMASQTLAITLVSTLICIALGLPIGIIAAKSDRLDGFIRPVLDMMQTMPSFVYLIPALMLFGLGKTPAVMSTCIYAIPPIIRLTNLGIRQVDSSVVEAGRAFGATSRQLLFKVQIPLAMPTVMAGLNQTVMMALAMVVIASMIGARGLGTEVLNGIARVEPGRGLIAGVSIVFMAIILDRISQSFAKKPESRSSS